MKGMAVGHGTRVAQLTHPGRLTMFGGKHQGLRVLTRHIFDASKCQSIIPSCL